MTSSRKSKLAAIVGYLLVAIVVLGGMTWATIATFELAKRNLKEGDLRNDFVAVSEMDSYMRGILRSEKARAYTDYMAYHTTDYVEVRNSSDQKIGAADYVIVESPLKAHGPPYEWIDLYFQLHQNGEWCSPQLREIRPGVDLVAGTVSEARAVETMNWFRQALPEVELWEKVRRPGVRSGLVLAERYDKGKGTDAKARMGQQARRDIATLTAKELNRRVKINIAAQQQTKPQSQCVHVIEEEVDPYGRSRLRRRDAAHQVCVEEAQLGVQDEPMNVFWLPSAEDGSRKLGFVRQGYDNGQDVLQGFIGDWNLLSKSLLAQVEDIYPDAELKPVVADETIAPEDSAMELTSIPARLVVPKVPGALAAAAWQSIEGQLYLTWSITAVVLLLAGWGVHNLVALTNRRMQFAYAVTHELRTPLTTFRLYADMLSAGLVPDDAKTNYLETLNTESARLSSLVESILEYARLENHKVTLNSEATDATALLARIAENVEKRCRDNGVEARTENQVANGQAFRTDVGLIGQISAVLVNNACRHTRKAADPTVVVRLSSDDGAMHLDVIDNGPGIDRRDARTIFKPFRRGHQAAAAAHGGVGLGLALAREWAKLLGGRLDLAARHHDQLGGAHFRLTVPTRS